MNINLRLLSNQELADIFRRESINSLETVLDSDIALELARRAELYENLENAFESDEIECVFVAIEKTLGVKLGFSDPEAPEAPVITYITDRKGKVTAAYNSYFPARVWYPFVWHANTQTWIDAAGRYSPARLEKMIDAGNARLMTD